MAEYLLRGTSGGFSASENCVVLFLFALRLLVVAVCVTQDRKMADKSNHSGPMIDTSVGEVKELQRQLPRARSTAEIFAIFLEQVEKLFPFIMHASVLLLPNDLKKRETDQALPGGSNNKRGRGNSDELLVSFTQPDDAIQQLVERVFGAQADLDWANCCVFNLHKGRGPVVQSPPHWPVSCAATYHSGVVMSSIVSTPDYAKYGPHFSDWKALYEKGAKSMIAVPMYSCKQAVAVLCLASSVINAFEREHAISSLASVLAPYTGRLKYTTRRMEIRMLVNDFIAPFAARQNQKRDVLAIKCTARSCACLCHDGTPPVDVDWCLERHRDHGPYKQMARKEGRTSEASEEVGPGVETQDNAFGFVRGNGSLCMNGGGHCHDD